MNRWEDGKKVYDYARTIFPLVIPVTVEVLDRARELMDEHQRISARDALHASIVELHSLEAVCSYDSDFDSIGGIRRVKPS